MEEDVGAILGVVWLKKVTRALRGVRTLSDFWRLDFGPDRLIIKFGNNNVQMYVDLRADVVRGNCLISVVSSQLYREICKILDSKVKIVVDGKQVSLCSVDGRVLSTLPCCAGTDTIDDYGDFSRHADFGHAEFLQAAMSASCFVLADPYWAYAEIYRKTAMCDYGDRIEFVGSGHRLFGGSFLRLAGEPYPDSKFHLHTYDYSGFKFLAALNHQAPYRISFNDKFLIIMAAGLKIELKNTGDEYVDYHGHIKLDARQHVINVDRMQLIRLLSTIKIKDRDYHRIKLVLVGTVLSIYHNGTDCGSVNNACNCGLIDAGQMLATSTANDVSMVFKLADFLRLLKSLNTARVQIVLPNEDLPILLRDLGGADNYRLIMSTALDINEREIF